MIFKSFIINILLYLLILGVGLDLFISGILLLIYNDTSKIPKSLGYLIITRMTRGEKNYKGISKLVKLQFNLRFWSLNCIFSGVLLIFIVIVFFISIWVS